MADPLTGVALEPACLCEIYRSNLWKPDESVSGVGSTLELSAATHPAHSIVPEQAVVIILLGGT
jgi:hypothetical protein